MIKVKYIGKEYMASFDNDAIYDVLDVIEPMPKVICYQIQDELKDVAYYPWSDFLIVEGFEEARTYGIKAKDPRTV